MRRSAIRELLKLTARPEVISFAGGLPAAELFPVDRVERAMRAVLARHGGRCLQYGETEGVAELREWVAQRYSTARCRVRPENVLITSGAQQALDLAGRVFLDEGDEVVVENPTYLALLSAWRPFGARFRPVPSDARGLRVDALEPLLARRPKLLYLVPNFQNPQGTTLSLERRRRLVHCLRESKVPLVEDDPYGELRYGGEPLPGLLELDAVERPAAGLDSQVIFTGTFSKVLMPGLRVGWAIAAGEVIDKLVQAKQAADLHTSTLCQHLALELLRTGFLEEVLPVFRDAYRRRRDAMLDALDRHFPPGAAWTRPEGGMFLLVTLPADVDAGRLLPRALAQGVAFVPGEAFHLGEEGTAPRTPNSGSPGRLRLETPGHGRNTLRLNFSQARPEQIETGIRRLAGVLLPAEEAQGDDERDDAPDDHDGDLAGDGGQAGAVDHDRAHALDERRQR
jgi:2-aminoadipate transaminase